MHARLHLLSHTHTKSFRTMQECVVMWTFNRLSLLLLSRLCVCPWVSASKCACQHPSGSSMLLSSSGGLVSSCPSSSPLCQRRDDDDPGFSYSKTDKSRKVRRRLQGRIMTSKPKVTHCCVNTTALFLLHICPSFTDNSDLRMGCDCSPISTPKTRFIHPVNSPPLNVMLWSKTNNKFQMQQSQNNPLIELFLCVFSKHNNGVVQTWDFILNEIQFSSIRQNSI